MVKAEEGTFEIGGEKLYTKTWLPDGPIKAKVVLLHGFSDHVNNYWELGPTLAGQGIAVHGFDQRGWGRSVHTPADRGRTGPTDMVVGEMAAFIQARLDEDDKGEAAHAKAETGAAAVAPPPVFVLAHSMGGNLAATMMAAPTGSALATNVVSRVRGWLLDAPFFGFMAGEEPSRLKISVGRLAGRLLPNFQLKHEIPAAQLSRDPAVVAHIAADPLCHDIGTLESLAAMLDRTNELAAGFCVPNADSVRALWLGHGTLDQVASYEASRRWFDALPAGLTQGDATFRKYEGWFHMLHGEPEADRRVFFQELSEWILARSETGKGEDAASETKGQQPTSQAPATSTTAPVVAQDAGASAPPVVSAAPEAASTAAAAAELDTSASNDASKL